MGVVLARIALSVIVVALVMLAKSASGPNGGRVAFAQASPAIDFCIKPPLDRLCAEIPFDIALPPDFPNGYSGLSDGGQRPFDLFAWQMFVALNWPAKDGKPLPVQIGSRPGAPRIWQAYPSPASVFGGADSACGETAGAPVFTQMAKIQGDGEDTFSGFLQAFSDKPLIDRGLNFVVYDIRLNTTEVGYIKGNGLDTKQGQKEFQREGKTVNFPLGHYTDETSRRGGSVGAIEIKSAWRILDAKTDDIDSYYTLDGLIPVASKNSETGKPLCIKARLGLVGMHIMQRTATHGEAWIWGTFEHAGNAPTAANALSPEIKVLPDDWKTWRCKPPRSARKDHAFFNPSCRQCVPNKGPDKGTGEKYYKWSERPPHAAKYAVDGKYGTQVVRCFDIYGPTAELNALWRAKLASTVWTNYMLVNTQWQTHQDSPPFTEIDLPTYLANTTMETYFQVNKLGSCIACHALATTTTHQDANFSFQLHEAK